MKTLTKKLVLTDLQRDNCYVEYEVNMYSLYCKTEFGMMFLSSYFTKGGLAADLALNNIKPKMSERAATKYMQQMIAF